MCVINCKVICDVEFGIKIKEKNSIFSQNIQNVSVDSEQTTSVFYNYSLQLKEQSFYLD